MAKKHHNIKDAVIAATYQCNSHCQMCNIWQRQDYCNGLPNSSYNNLPPSLRNINITGGEPFLKDDLPAIIKIIKHRCPKADIIISTNGFAADIIIKHLKEIIKIAPKVGVAVSIDGIGNKHNEIRGVKNGYEQALQTIEELKKIGIKKIKIAFTLGDYNCEELPKVYHLAERLKLEFSLALVHSSGNYFNKENKIEKKEEIIRRLDWLINQELRKWNLKNWARAYFAFGLKNFIITGKRILPDYSGELNIFIDPAGNIYPNDIAVEKIGAISSSGFAITSEKYSIAENWMICTARQAIIKHWFKAGCWVIITGLTRFLRF